MIIGVQPITYQPNPQEALHELVRAANDFGVDALFIMDHLLQVQERQWEPMLDAFTTLGYLASMTRRQLGINVANVNRYQPKQLVFLAQTLDQLASGKAHIGLGAGWYRDEAAIYGFELTKRWEQLWTTVEAFRGIECNLFIGGKGLPRSVAVAEYYGIGYDLWNPKPYDLDENRIFFGLHNQIPTEQLSATIPLYENVSVERIREWLERLEAAGYGRVTFTANDPILLCRCIDFARRSTIESSLG